MVLKIFLLINMEHMMRKVLFIVKNPTEASSRFRVFAFYERLKKEFYVDTFYAEYHNKKIPKIFRSLIKRFRFLYLLWIAKQYDVLYMQRPMSSDKSNSTLFESMLVKINPNLIFDYDDALFIQNETKMRSLVSLAHTCVCGNSYLEAFAKKYNHNTLVIPTVIDTDRYQSSKNNKESTITVGWTGTSGNYQFFTQKMIDDIQIILNENSHVEFLFICDNPPPKKFNFSYQFIKWTAANEIQDLQMIDIGLMPLIDSPWSRGKCGFKLIQYASIGIASIASNVGVNNEVIIDKKSGILVKNDQWKEAIQKLIDDRVLATEMGEQAKQHIFKNYSVTASYPLLSKLLKNI